MQLGATVADNASPDPLRVHHADAYRPDIDGLRAVAVLLVVGYHAFPHLLPGGFIGVDIFFVISGYLITGILLDDLGRGRFSLAGFYARRVRRILPALTLVLAACLLYGWFALLRFEYAQLLQHVGWGAGFLSNFLLWHESGLYFDAAAETKPLLHLWSLGVEEQFYLLWPLVLWVAYEFRAIAPAIAGIALLSFGLNVWGVGGDPLGTFYLPHSRFWELMVGALLASLPHLRAPMPASRADDPYAPEVDALIADVKSWLGLLFIVSGVVLIDTHAAFPGWWALLPTVGAALLISAGPGAVLNRVVLSHPGAVSVGLVSYPLYLWHWPLLAFLRVDYGGTPPAAVRLLAVALSIGLAFATYRWLERPMRRVRPRWPRMAVPVAALATLGGVALSASGLARQLPEQLQVARIGEAQPGAYFEYLRARYFPCTPEAIFERAQTTGPGIKRCFQSRKTGARDVVLIGDSHAEHLFAGFAEALPEKNVVYYLGGSTPVADSVEYHEIFESVLADPTLSTVVLSAYWMLKTTQFATAEIMQNELTKTIGALTARGKSVFLLDDVPSFSFDPASCKYMRPLSRRSICAEARAHIETQRESYLSVLEAVRDGTQAQLVDVMHYFCGPQECRMERDGTMLFRDRHHLNLEGSRYLGRRLAIDHPELAAPTAPVRRRTTEGGFSRS